MKILLLLMTVIILSLQADYVKETIAVCSAEETLTELQEYSKDHLLEKGGLELELWLLGHNCQVIDKNTKIQVLDYIGKETEVLKILLQKSKDVVYALNKGIQIEQPGNKDIIYKF